MGTLGQKTWYDHERFLKVLVRFQPGQLIFHFPTDALGLNKKVMEKTINAIENGHGEDSSFWQVGNITGAVSGGGKIGSITEARKPILWDGHGIIGELLVYRICGETGNLLIEVEANSSLTIYYKQP